MCTGSRLALPCLAFVFFCCSVWSVRSVKRGYSIGVRLIDEFLAKSNVSTPGACADLREAADVIAKVRQKRLPGGLYTGTYFCAFV